MRVPMILPQQKARAIFLGLLVLLSPLCLFSQNDAAAGQIQGTVVSSDRQPLVRASVLAQRQPGSGAQFRATTFTGPEGGFLLSGLPAGVYRVCFQLPGTTFLNPCTWSAAPPTVAVMAGQTASLGELQLENGYLVRVLLTDAAGLLQTDEGRVPGARVQVGVWTPNGLFLPLRVRTRNAASRTLELPVPFGAAIVLSARSGFYDLTDETNARVDAASGARIPIQAAPDTPPSIHTFHVTGRRAVP